MIYRISSAYLHRDNDNPSRRKGVCLAIFDSTSVEKAG